MGLFHMMLTLQCPHCGEKLIRVAPTEYLDLAVCPGCLASGPYDGVVEAEVELDNEAPLPVEVTEYVRSIHPAPAR